MKSIIIIGGQQAKNSTEIFNMDMKTVISGPPLPMEVRSRGSVVKDKFGRIFIIGGSSEDSSSIDHQYPQFSISRSR